MVYLLRGTNEDGDPVEVAVESCWRCGVMINVYLLSMAEHVERAHPVPGPRRPDDVARHALD